MKTPRHSGFELRGRHVLAAMIAFFTLVIAVNVGFAVLAVQSFPGEDVPHSYLQGLHYNQTLAARRAQETLGWRVEAALIKARSGAGAEVDLRLIGPGDAPISDAAVVATLQRPTDGRLDRALAFRGDGDGRYTAALGALPAGRWRLRGHVQDARGGVRDFEAEFSWRLSR